MRTVGLLFAILGAFWSSTIARAALTLQWVQNSIDPAAFTTGNSTPNGKLPAGAQSWDLRMRTTGSSQFTAIIIRLTKSSGSFYRHSYVDPKNMSVTLQPFERLARPSDSNPARSLSTYATVPLDDGSAASFPPGFFELVLSDEGRQVRAPRVVADREINASWFEPIELAPLNISPGDYTLGRFTFTGDLPLVRTGSEVYYFERGGGVPPPIAVAQIPEPSVVESSAIGMIALLLGIKRIRS